MNKFIVSSSPHFQSNTTQTLMLDVFGADPGDDCVRHHFRLPRGSYYPDDGRVPAAERIHIPPRHEAPPVMVTFPAL